MQLYLAMEDDGATDALLRVREQLLQAFGPLPSPLRRDPVTHLVRAILSARTQDAVTDAVMMRLRSAFRPIQRLAEAHTEEVQALIAPVTHAERKAPRLIEALRRIGRLRGRVSLDFLADWPVDDAMVWLQELPGVGQKAAASVLNLSALRRRVMVVDGHVHRAAVRTGLAGQGADAGEARRRLMARAPDGWEADDFAELHALLKRLGQLHCHAAMPECPGCPLRRACPDGARRFGDRRSVAEKEWIVGPSPGAANENVSRDGLDAYLRRRVAHIEARGRRLPAEGAAPVSLGLPVLDAALGGAGLPPGAHQGATVAPGDYAAPLILPVTAAAQVTEAAAVKLLIVQEREAAREGGELYAPGLEALGVKPEQTAFVRVKEGAEVLRVTDEAVKRRAVPVVLAELRRGASLADLAATRRLNLAAQRRGLFLFFITPDLAATSAALTRWRIASAPSRAPPRRIGPPTFHLHLHRNRLGPTGAWEAEWSPRERRFTQAVPLVDLAAAPVAAPVGADASYRSAAAGAA